MPTSTRRRAQARNPLADATPIDVIDMDNTSDELHDEIAADDADSGAEQYVQDVDEEEDDDDAGKSPAVFRILSAR